MLLLCHEAMPVVWLQQPLSAAAVLCLRGGVQSVPSVQAYTPHPQRKSKLKRCWADHQQILRYSCCDAPPRRCTTVTYGKQCRQSLGCCLVCCCCCCRQPMCTAPVCVDCAVWLLAGACAAPELCPQPPNAAGAVASSHDVTNCAVLHGAYGNMMWWP
jgi:hypothetical protein